MLHPALMIEPESGYVKEKGEVNLMAIHCQHIQTYVVSLWMTCLPRSTL